MNLWENNEEMTDQMEPFICFIFGIFLALKLLQHSSVHF